MDCERIAGICGRQGTKLATLVITWVFIVLAAIGAAFAQAPTSGEVLNQAKQYEYRYREGDATVLSPWVTMLEEATTTEPGNADLWYALGYVYLARGAQAMMPGGEPSGAMVAMQKGPAALRRALQLNPDHPEALSQVGGIQVLMGTMMQAPAMVARGVAQMNRAAELAPDSMRVRLMRAFAGPTLPAELRNYEREAADLDFLIEAASWNRAGDYMGILRADLDFEAGKLDAARNLYGIVANSTSSAAQLAKARLAALDLGGVDMADITALRTAAGAQCTMCHGP